MLPLPLSASDLQSFEAQLSASRRRTRVTLQFYGKNGNPLSYSDAVRPISATVTGDITNPKTEPALTAQLVLTDPHEELVIDTTDVSSGGLWFSKQVSLSWGLWVPSLAKWVDVPQFYGYFLVTERSGIEVTLDCYDKSAQHLPPHDFPKSYSLRKHTKINKGIRSIFEDRGETRFNLDSVNDRISKDKQWIIGQTPWKVAYNLADSIDYQLI